MHPMCYVVTLVANQLSKVVVMQTKQQQRGTEQITTSHTERSEAVRSNCQLK